MRIGFAGTHRIGKSTTAKMLAESLGFEYISAGLSPVYLSYGFVPSSVMPLRQRLLIQRDILHYYMGLVRDKTNFVIDRTPLDFIAYTLAEVNTEAAHSLVDVAELNLARYIADCFDELNKSLDLVIVLSPGIEIVKDETKGVCSPIFIEKIHMLMMSLIRDIRSTVPTYSIDRFVTDRDERVDACKYALSELSSQLRDAASHIALH